MKRVKIILCPFDTVVFRESRPFEIGGYARSLEGPLPSTFSGVIRSLLREEFRNRKDLYEDENKLKWKVRGPFLSLIKECEVNVKINEFYSLPNDVFREKNGELVVPKPSEPYSYQIGKLKLMSPPRLKDGEILERPKENLMNRRALVAYLEGRSLMKDWIKDSNELSGRVERPGVTLDESKTVRFGMFYRVEALEALWKFKGKEIIRSGYVGTILGDEDAVSKLEISIRKKIARFGGESRPSSIMMMPEEEDKEWEKAKRRIANRISSSRRFKVYLATPTIFGNNNVSKWIPEWLDTQTLEGSFLGKGPKVRLVGVSMGKCLAVSGWDYARGCVKPMYFGVPAGSVFYFKFEENVGAEEIYENVIKRLENENMSDIMSLLGFGTAFVGVW